MKSWLIGKDPDARNDWRQRKRELQTTIWLDRIINSAAAATATAKSLQSCPTLWDPIDDRLPRSAVPGILQARTLEWVAISFSNTWKWKVKMRSLSHVQLFATPWTVAYQAFPSTGFSRQEYWSGMPSLPPIIKSMTWIWTNSGR